MCIISTFISFIRFYQEKVFTVYLKGQLNDLCVVVGCTVDIPCHGELVDWLLAEWSGYQMPVSHNPMQAVGTRASLDKHLGQAEARSDTVRQNMAKTVDAVPDLPLT